MVLPPMAGFPAQDIIQAAHSFHYVGPFVEHYTFSPVATNEIVSTSILGLSSFTIL
jgi:hypothetical protein